ncbi:methionyl-tRNA formyltransferase [Aurantiacibacter poecillastricola]|uniref:methionyl-tRNA formyltransferase n=1 Tax=Aurantiacibacter poecillastricola TaxID=3064385 RepID=UPI00273DFDEE|nr:formyltransferase family protein [Aurantiacibacter sp. 219JJ12-13]MDP5259987.1 formyltransferase family protein [Aurantiacibacter sp. 219JJ12-13]
MRAVVVGAVESTAVLADALARADGWSVPLIVTLPKDLEARHSDFVDMQPYAQRLGAQLHFARNSNDADTLAAIDKAEPDYIFVVGWSQICKPEFLALRPGKVIGYHPAPLPRLRGRAVIPWTILLEEKITASSLFWVDEGTDSGDLLSQRYFHIASDETAQELYDKHMHSLKLMLDDLLPRMARGEEPRIVQDHRYATWAARRTPADGAIDWQASAAEIDRLVRAVGRPYPGAFTFRGEARITVWSTALETGAEQYHGMPGQIVRNEEGELIVQTGDGLVRLVEWEMDGAGTPPMHAILGERR